MRNPVACHGRVLAVALIATVTACSAALASDAEGVADAPGRWPVEQAATWQAAQPWLVGCNYIPSTAINQLEMFQAETFDPATIDRELGWARGLGFTSVRVFLHDLLWEQDRVGFLGRCDEFLTIADRHGISVMFVLFDSCWHPQPVLGPQPAPLPFTHNSGWVQAPGAAALADPASRSRLEAYVKGVVRRFATDRRVVVWDIWNEPDNLDGGSVKRPGLEPKDKVALVNTLLPQAFTWAREARPSQPLTSGVWRDSGNVARLDDCKRIQVAHSDVLSFHAYGDAATLERCIDRLSAYGRPLLCTEFMARPVGSTFDPHLAIMKRRRVAAYCWGFVDGKSQTIYPWDSWKKNYDGPPPVWFHDILRTDGTPYSATEAAFIRRTTGVTP